MQTPTNPPNDLKAAVNALIQKGSLTNAGGELVLQALQNKQNTPQEKSGFQQTVSTLSSGGTKYGAVASVFSQLLQMGDISLASSLAAALGGWHSGPMPIGTSGPTPIGTSGPTPIGTSGPTPIGNIVALPGVDKGDPFELGWDAGTPVLLASGSFAPIEKIQAGDVVAALDEKTGTIRSSRVVSNKVASQQPVFTVTLSDGGIIRGAGKASFHVGERGFNTAEQLKTGSKLAAHGGKAVQVSRIDAATRRFYRLQLADAATYFVGESKVGVRNG
jgi:hypothetical protein